MYINRIFLAVEVTALRKRNSQFTSRVTSISENEMNIRISLCNFRHVNGMLNIFLKISPKKTHLQKKKKIQNTWETILFLNYLML